MSKSTLLHQNTEFTYDSLVRLQSLPLEQKILLTQRRIKQFYDAKDGKVFVSFSGGKDSTVLLDICRKMYPEIKACFIDTGLEFPEIRDFVKSIANVDWVKPKKTFKEVIDHYGIPLPSKEISEAVYEYNTTKSEKLKEHRMKVLKGKWNFLISAPFKVSNKCCNVMKKSPSKKYEKDTGTFPIIGTMATESRLRLKSYYRHGCTIFDGSRPRTMPLSFWTEEDIWEYIKKYNIVYSEIYNKGYYRTGCMFCLFGYYSKGISHDQFDKLKTTHPSVYKYCMEDLKYKEIIEYCNKHLVKR